MMLDELQRLNARIDEEEQQPQGRYADRFPWGRDGDFLFFFTYLGLNFLLMSELYYFKSGHSSKSDLKLGYFQFH